MLDELEKQLLEKLEGKSGRAVLNHEVEAGAVRARVSVQRDRKGSPVLRYWFEESRVDRSTFQTLTCSQTRCPRHQSVLQKWRVHTGRALATRLEPIEFKRHAVLAAEERLLLGDQVFTAREAVFPVEFHCPQGVHDPVRIQVKGWDVFGPAGYMAGGWAGEGPRFETLEQVQAWLVQPQPLPVA